jgi:penicillin amidase
VQSNNAENQSANLDVAGVTLPGVPYVIVGHNRRIAWGFTNVGPTVTDAFIENFNAQGEYQTPQGWRQPEHRTEIIHVKGKPDVTLDVRTTRHGPIVTDLLPGETRQVALRWTLYDGLHMLFFDVDTAQNWEQFRKAFSQLDAPGQNVVYADVDGNIGYQTTGRIPIRASGDGSLPVSGADDAHEWTGYIPFNKLPSIYNPPSGVIATANGRITPDNYPYSISVEWEAPWRTERIYHVLESGREFTPADMLALQNDIHSENGRALCLRRRPRCQAFCARPAGRRPVAQLGWANAGLLRRAHNRCALRAGIDPASARAAPRSCAARSEAVGEHIELENLSVGDADGVASEHLAASTQTLAA